MLTGISTLRGQLFAVSEVGLEFVGALVRVEHRGNTSLFSRSHTHGWVVLTVSPLVCTWMVVLQ